MFVLKVVMKLHETSALNLESYFYKDLRSIAKIKTICALKMLIATSLNVHRLFLKKSMMTIIIAHEKFNVMELLIKKYDVTLSSHSIHFALWKKKSCQYLLKLSININRKKDDQTSFMLVVKIESFEFIVDLTSTIDIDINERDQEFKNSLKRATWAHCYISFDEILLNHEIDVQEKKVDISLLDVVARDRWTFVERFLIQEANVNATIKYEKTSLQLLFEDDLFDSNVWNDILRNLIVVELNINETYKRTSFLCLQVFEVKKCKTFYNDHYDEH